MSRPPKNDPWLRCLDAHRAHVAKMIAVTSAAIKEKRSPTPDELAEWNKLADEWPKVINAALYLDRSDPPPEAISYGRKLAAELNLHSD